MDYRVQLFSYPLSSSFSLPVFMPSDLCVTDHRVGEELRWWILLCFSLFFCSWRLHFRNHFSCLLSKLQFFPIYNNIKRRYMLLGLKLANFMSILICNQQIFYCSFLVYCWVLMTLTCYSLLLVETDSYLHHSRIFCSWPLILIELPFFTTLFLNACLILAGLTVPWIWS